MNCVAKDVAFEMKGTSMIKVRKRNVNKCIKIFYVVAGMFLVCLMCMIPALSVEAHGQNAPYVVTVYNERNGLPTGEANAVLQTADGYIWIGSYGGLIRYDGTNFRNYSVERKIESNSIRALFEDSKGRLWIGTNDAGVVVLEDDVFTKISVPEDRSFLCIRGFAEDANGTIYVASNSGLAKIENDIIVPYEADELKGNTVYSVAIDTYGRVWGAASNGECVVVDDDAEPTILSSDLFFDDADVYSIDADAEGNIVIGGSGNRVAYVEFQSEELGAEGFNIKYYSTGNVTVHNAVKACENGDIMVSGNNGLAVISSEEKLTEFGEDENAVSVNAAIADYENDIWLASSAYGIIKYSQGCISGIDARAGLDGVAINTIARQEGIWYIGNDTGLILCDKDWNRIENALTEQYDGTRIRCIKADGKGNVWIASYSDFPVVCYNSKDASIREYSTDNGLTGNKARVVTELSDGRIAVGTQSGIDIFRDGELVENYTHEDGLDNPTILCISEGEKGELVAGSDGGGIYVIEDGEITNYGFEEGLGEGVVLRMLRDEENGGWFVSAGSSLYYWQNDKTFWQVTNFRKDAGSIFEFYERDGKLWLLQNNGILELDKAQLLSGEETEVIRHDFGHGLTGSLNANTWNYEADDGKLYMSTRSGISIFGFETVNNALPKVMVQSVNVDGKSYEHPTELSVEGGAQRVTIDFAALSFTDTMEIRLAYCLDGFDKEPIVLDDKSGSVSYTNLPGGDYTFRVWVYELGDAEHYKEYSIRLTKERQLYEKPLFWVLVGLAGAAAVAGVVWLIAELRMRRIHRRQQEYKSIVDQSLLTFAKTIDAKDKYTKGHSTRVAAYSKELAKRLGMSETEQERIYYIALMHDIGKIGVPDSILNKPGKLTEEEMDIIRSHVNVGGDILKDFTALDGISDGARYHHERCDGKGYCMGLTKDEIPRVARIIGVADSYDAMASDRCYRKALPEEVIIDELKQCSGTQFDPEVVPHMLAMIEEGIVPMKEAE